MKCDVCYEDKDAAVFRKCGKKCAVNCCRLCVVAMARHTCPHCQQAFKYTVAERARPVLRGLLFAALIPVNIVWHLLCWLFFLFVSYAIGLGAVLSCQDLTPVVEVFFGVRSYADEDADPPSCTVFIFLLIGFTHAPNCRASLWMGVVRRRMTALLKK